MVKMVIANEQKTIVKREEKKNNKEGINQGRKVREIKVIIHTKVQSQKTMQFISPYMEITRYRKLNNH